LAASTPIYGVNSDDDRNFEAGVIARKSAVWVAQKLKHFADIIYRIQFRNAQSLKMLM